jgi:hypothetical protein
MPAAVSKCQRSIDSLTTKWLAICRIQFQRPNDAVAPPGKKEQQKDLARQANMLRVADAEVPKEVPVQGLEEHGEFGDNEDDIEDCCEHGECATEVFANSMVAGLLNPLYCHVQMISS